MLTTLSALLLGALGPRQDEGVRAAPAPAVPCAEGFRYVAGRIQAGRVHRYKKSNRDGSNPSEIALYLAGEARIEVLKWHRGEPGATLVVAQMDWETCSVSAFENLRIDEHGQRSLVAELATSADKKRLVARLGEREMACELERFPWHSYDFDFSSLNVALRFLADPEGETEFAIVDPVHGPKGPELVAKGNVVLAYAGPEERAGRACRRYLLDGPGLEERGGSLWAARGDEDGEVFLVAFELDLPDEPGMSSGRLEWYRDEMRSSDEWEAFVRTRPAEPEHPSEPR